MPAYVPYSPEWHMEMDLHATQRERDLAQAAIARLIQESPVKPEGVTEWTWQRFLAAKDHREPRFNNV